MRRQNAGIFPLPASSVPGVRKEEIPMIRPQRAVLVLEEDRMIPENSKPLMLEAVLARPMLTWAAEQLLADGVQRFFVVCPPRFAQAAGACFPAGAVVTVSEQQTDLEAFLDTDEPVLVLPRAAVPLAEAGVGLAYAAAGRTLQEAWRVKMTNAVQDATLIPGWLPIFGPETVAEVEPIFRAKQQKNG